MKDRLNVEKFKIVITRDGNILPYNKRETGMNMLSLFANIGVAEAYLKKIGVNVVIANELIERRAILYSKIYPETHMICGDITNVCRRLKKW